MPHFTYAKLRGRITEKFGTRSGGTFTHYHFKEVDW